MPTKFHYTAKSVSGQSSTGLLEAPSPAQARQSLRESGLFPLTVRPEGAPVVSSPVRTPIGSTRRNVRKSDLLMVTTQLSIMCQSGIDLAEGLRSVAQECRQPDLRKTLMEIYQDVSNGMPTSAAMDKHRKLFGEAYVASVAAAEASGAVTQVLARLATLLRNEIQLQNGLKSVAAYPAVLMGVAAVVMSVLVFFVLPQFSQVFETLGRPAPPITRLLLDTAQLLRANVFGILGGVVMAALAVSRLVRSEEAGRYWDRLVLFGPIVSRASRSLLTGRAFRTMGTMLQSGVPLLEAVRMCRTSVRNRFFRELFHELEQDVVNGNGVAAALSRSEFIPGGAAQMVGTAERTGKLGEVMELIGEFYEEEGEQLIRGVVKLLEPLIIVIMGVVVAGVVLSVILPLLDVSTISK